MTATEEKKWAWGNIYDVNGMHGPFKTMKAAINNAKKRGVETVDLYTVEYPDPGDYFGLTVPLAIEEADDIAKQSAFRHGDKVFFKVKRADLREAQEDLDELMRAWAKSWVKPTAMIVKFVDTVTVS